ncbi:MAG TPA: hypothetical protein VFV85_03985 [Conexibacter sp.]|nr:hypothetical protein [Conexibacter sp.]
MRSPIRILAAALALALLGAALPAVAGAKAKKGCKHGTVKHAGACVPKPPRGVPFAGYYATTTAQGTVALGVQHTGAGWRVVLKVTALPSTITCADGSRPPYAFFTKGTAKLRGTRFDWRGTYNGSATSGSGKFLTARKVQVSGSIPGSNGAGVYGDGVACTADYAISGALKPGTSRDLA